MIVDNVSGPSSFTMDPRRHRIVENTISLPPNIRRTHLLPDRQTANVLVEAFFMNVSYSTPGKLFLAHTPDQWPYRSLSPQVFLEHLRRVLRRSSQRRSILALPTIPYFCHWFGHCNSKSGHSRRSNHREATSGTCRSSRVVLFRCKTPQRSPRWV
jgi:hypothetical protein